MSNVLFFIMESGQFCDESKDLIGNKDKLNKEDFLVRHYYASIFVARVWRNIQKGTILKNLKN